MLNIVIDTNILRSESTYKTYNFKLLKKLVEQEHIKIYIPEIVEKEYLSHQYEEFKVNISKLKIAQKNLINLIHDDVVFRRLSGISKTISSMEEYDRNKIESNWNRFKKDLNIEVISTPDIIMNQVINSYFNGDKPFKNIKSRKDFPDAFIYQSVKYYFDTREYYFICGDGVLKSSFDLISNVNTYSSLKAFFECKEIKKYTSELLENAISDNMTFLKDHKSIIENKVGDFIDEEILGYLYKEEDNIEYEIVGSTWGLFHNIEINKLIDSNDIEIRFELQINGEVYDEIDEEHSFEHKQLLVVGTLSCQLENTKLKSISNLEEMNIGDLNICFICEYE